MPKSQKRRIEGGGGDAAEQFRTAGLMTRMQHGVKTKDSNPSNMGSDCTVLNGLNCRVAVRVTLHIQQKIQQARTTIYHHLISDKMTGRLFFFFFFTVSHSPLAWEICTVL